MSTTPEQTTARVAVAEEVLALMGRRRISQTKLAAGMTAKGVKMSQPSLSRRLDGLLPFDTDELLAIAEVLDVEVTALFSGLADQGGPSSPWITTECFPVETQCDGQLDLMDAA